MANVGLTVILTERSRAAKALALILSGPLKDKFTISQVSLKTTAGEAYMNIETAFFSL